MTYAFTQDLPADAAGYIAITERMGPDIPDGLITHVACALPEGGVRLITVWESEDAYDVFANGRLIPTITDLMGPDMPPEPPRTALSVIHVWGSGPS